MPAKDIPDRIVWAVETLAVDPSDQVLEIGCGHGFAVALVCDRLRRGTLTAIDRSAKMIAAAKKRNAPHVTAGKVRFETIALADADFGRRRFSKVFAINVNLFWIEPAKELPIVRRLLRPDGALYLFYQPPSPAQVKPLAAKLSHNLEGAGFTVDRVVRSHAPAGFLCMISRPAKEAR
jgi:SAM-dependent methyltransferase